MSVRPLFIILRCTRAKTKFWLLWRNSLHNKLNWIFTQLLAKSGFCAFASKTFEIFFMIFNVKKYSYKEFHVLFVSYFVTIICGHLKKYLESISTVREHCFSWRELWLKIEFLRHSSLYVSIFCLHWCKKQQEKFPKKAHLYPFKEPFLSGKYKSREFIQNKPQD